MGCARTLFPASIARVLSSPDDAGHNAVGVGQKIETVTSQAEIPFAEKRSSHANPEKTATTCLAIIVVYTVFLCISGVHANKRWTPLVRPSFFLPATHVFVAQRPLVGRRYIALTDAVRKTPSNNVPIMCLRLLDRAASDRIPDHAGYVPRCNPELLGYKSNKI